VPSVTKTSTLKLQAQDRGACLEFRPTPGAKPIPPDMDGHPENMAWFCEGHHGAASKLGHLTLGEALVQMR
jgi:hypothetical protein